MGHFPLAVVAISWARAAVKSRRNQSPSSPKRKRPISRLTVSFDEWNRRSDLVGIDFCRLFREFTEADLFQYQCNRPDRALPSSFLQISLKAAMNFNLVWPILYVFLSLVKLYCVVPSLTPIGSARPRLSRVLLGSTVWCAGFDRVFCAWRVECWRGKCAANGPACRAVLQVNLAEVTTVQWLDKKGTAIVCLSLAKEGRLLLKTSHNLNGWFQDFQVRTPHPR